MDAFQRGVEVTVETSPVSPLAMRELVDALGAELSDWALQREKVLEKLDLRGARRARRALLDLRGALRSALERGRVDEGEFATVLEEAHRILSGPSSEDDTPSVPPESLVSAVRRITRNMPAVVPMYADDEPTLPGHRRAALISLTAADADDDDERTAAGLPNEVLANYLREVHRAAG